MGEEKRPDKISCGCSAFSEPRPGLCLHCPALLTGSAWLIWDLLPPLSLPLSHSSVPDPPGPMALLGPAALEKEGPGIPQAHVWIAHSLQ